MADFKSREFQFTGKLVTSKPGAVISENFRRLENLRYTGTHIQGIKGMTKVNSTELSGKTIRNGTHFIKDQTGESHVVVQAFPSTGAPVIYTNDTAIPDAGDFNATALYTEDASADTAYMSTAPLGSMVCTDTKESLIWGGDEFRVGAFINYDPSGTFSYDYTEAVRNSLTDNLNVASVQGTDGGIDGNTNLCLHFDDNVTDSSGDAVVVTNNSVTFSSGVKVFGTHSASFDGASGYLTAPDSDNFSCSAGKFAIDMRWRPGAAAEGTLWYQETDASNYMELYQTAGLGVAFEIVAAGSSVVSFSTGDSVLTVDTFSHVEIDENGDDWYIFVDGIQRAYTSDASRAANYTGAVHIGLDGSGGSNYAEGYMDELRFSQVERHTYRFEVPSAAYSTTAAQPYFYVGSTRPLQGIKFYIETANTQASTMSIDFWTGAWTSIVTVSDGTSAGGISLAKTGWVTFDDTQDVAKVKSIDGIVLYWYRVQISAADSATEIYQVTTDAAMQPIVDIWNGIEREILKFMLYKGSYQEYTGNVYQNVYDSTDGGTFVELDSLATNQYMVFGFTEQMMGLQINLYGGKENSTADTQATVAYWNGTDWSTVGDLDDGTISGTSSFGQSGTIAWSPVPADNEFKTDLDKNVPLYYYKVSFSAALSGDVQMFYVAGIPAPIAINGHKFCMEAGGRVWLLNETSEHRNRAICSAMDAPDVWNGDDTQEFFFGDDSELMCGFPLFTQFGSSLYNMSVFCKRNEIWAVVGSTPEDWVSFRVSSTVGCVAPGTAIVVSVGYEAEGAKNNHLAFFQAADGVYVFDGRAATNISSDIENYFDNDDPECINPDMLERSQGFFDRQHQEYHWLFASGTSTTINKEMVFDLRRMRWFEVNRGTGKALSVGGHVQSTLGKPYTYGATGGYLQRLENGDTFDGNDIEHVVRFGDIPLHKNSMMAITKTRYAKLVTIEKSNASGIDVTHYRDGASTGSAMVTAMSDTLAGYEYSLPVRSLNWGDGTFHSFEFSISTNSSTPAFEPVLFGVLYDLVRQDITGHSD